MIIETATWGWPQWTILVLWFLGFGLTAMKHGQQRLVETGAHKGEPEKYNGFLALSKVALWMFVLIAGGFFA